MARLSVNRASCLRSGQCSYLHPELFEEGKDRYPRVLVSAPRAEQLEAARDAAEICPSQSIEVTEDDDAAKRS
ncbi:MAG: ferredoxin [Dehalococcoidia bacterium]